MADNYESVIERQSSVAVDQNAKGQYSFKVKIYYDDDVRSGEEVVKAVKNIYDALQGTFS